MAVTATHRIEANLSGSAVKDQIFDEELTDFDAVTPTWDKEVTAVADFNSETDADGDLNNNATAGHTGGNALEVTFDDANAAYGVMNASAIDQKSGWLSLWFDPNSFGLEVGKLIILANARSGVPLNSWQLLLYNVAGVYKLRMLYYNDTPTDTYDGTYITLADAYQKIDMVWKASTGAGNNDGWMRLYVGNDLMRDWTGHDNDTKDWDTIQVGMIYTSSTAFGGSFYLDTIKVDPVGAPMVDTIAAQSGTYGISIPVMDTTARYCSFTDPTAETAITAECNLDPNAITMGAAESFTFISGDAADFTVNLKYSGGYKINAVAALDAGSEATADYSITDAPHKIRVVWVASSVAAADDGYLKLYIDDVLQETLSGLDNDTLDIGSVYFGAYTGLDAGTYGIFYLDDCRWGPWVDLTSDVIGDITGYWGMMDNDPTTFIAETGPMEITMNNVSGVYTPGLTTSLVGWDKGTPIRLLFQYDGDTCVRFYGTIDSFDVSKEPFSNKRIKVIVTDWLDYAATHPMISPAIQTNKRGDEMLTTILADMPINPQDTDFSTGVNTFETAFDMGDFNTKAYSEMAKIAVSELAPIYLKKDPIYGETLVFESFWDRNGLIEPGNTYDNNMTSLEVEYGKNVINRFANIANPRYIEAGIKVLFSLGSPVRIGLDETIFIRGNYTDPSGGSPAVGANMIVPVITTDYLMYNAKVGGVNRSANLTIAATYGAAGVVYELTNGSVDICWITKLQARGYMVYKYNQVERAAEDTDSQDLYDIIEKKINQKYKKDPDQGYQYSQGIINIEANPRLKVNKVNFIANRSDALMTGWLTQDVGDMIYVKETIKEIDLWCWIQGVQFTISPTGLVRFSWVVKDAVESLANGKLTPIQIDQGTTAPDGLHFGYLPQISKNGINSRSVSCWIDTGAIDPVDSVLGDSAAGEAYGVITTTLKGAATSGMGFNWVGGGHAGGGAAGTGFMNVIVNSWTVNRGKWYAPEGSIVVNTRYHIAFTFEDFDVIASNPIIYIDNVAVALNEVDTPAGVYSGEEGADLTFGNLAGYEYPFDGKIEDVRIYNVALTPAEIATLYTDGAHGDGVTRGMVFHGPNVRTVDLDYYEDHTMVSTDRLIDNMYQFRGYKLGTVVTRLT